MSVQHHTGKEFVSKDGLFSLTPYFALLPEQLYREEDTDLWVNFLRENIPHNQSIQTEHIPLYGCVCLHEADQQKRPHCLAHLLQTSAQIADITFGMAYVATDCMVWVSVRNKQVQHANVYEVQTATDVLYHILNSLSQLAFPKETCVYLSGTVSIELQQLLEEYLVVKTFE